MSTLHAFTMPKWGIEMTEGTIAQWMIAEGSDFTKGETLTLIETDKITNEVETEFPASLARIVAPAGQTLPVGALLAVFADTGAAADAAAIDAFIADFTPAGARRAAPPPPAPVVPPASRPMIPDELAISPAARAHAQANGIDVSGLAGSGRNARLTLQDVDQAGKPPVPPPTGDPVFNGLSTIAVDDYFASPLAKRLAVHHEIDMRGIAGSGPRGRISKADILDRIKVDTTKSTPNLAADAPTAAPPEGGVEVVKMSPMRKAIARQLTLSKATIPHFYLRNSARIDALLAMRTQAKGATGEAPSINDYLIRAVALALRAHPDVNVQVHGDEIHRYSSADIAVAVATDKGLLTPIIRAADTKSVARISAEVKALAERARAGRLQPDEFQGGSFSISNLGMFGIEQFDAIINPPQGAILAVGAGRQETMATDHALSFSTRIKLSLSCDHRAIDGAVGAKFLADLTRLIEHPKELTR